MWSRKFVGVEAGAIFIVSLVLFTFGLAQQEIIGFESRFYLFALEMWRHGVGFFPTTYHEPYPDYPGTSTFLIDMAAKCFGHLNKLIAVLPSAIASSLTLSVTFVIGNHIHRRVGWAAVFFLLFTFTFITEARTISLDQYITLVTVLCFAVCYFKKPVWLIYILLFVGFAFRGPLGLVIPTGVVCAVYFVDKEWKKLFAFGVGAFLLLLLATAILMGIAFYTGEYFFMQDVLRMQVIGRLHDAHSPPNYFYVRDCLTGYFITYPLAFFMVWGFFKNKNFRKLLVATLVILVGLSIPSDKKMRYILPFSPFLALMCAYLFEEVKSNYHKYLRKIVNGIFFVFPLLLGGLIILYRIKHPAVMFNLFLIVGLLAALQLSNIIFRKNALLVLGTAATAFFLCNVLLIEKVTLQNNKTRDFVWQIETWRKAYHSPLVFFQEGPDGLPIKYLVNMKHESKPQFLYDVKELSKLNPNAIVIVAEDNYQHVTKAVWDNFLFLGQNYIGHDVVMVLMKQ